MFLVLLVIVLGLTTALLTNPAATGPTLPLADEDVGKVASADIRAPISFTARGARMPEFSMITRVSIGWSQEGAIPGIDAASLSSARMSSLVTPSRHISLGSRVTTVSIIPAGAGSSGESALPAFPTTRATSGTCDIILFCMIIASTVAENPAWLSSEGMKRKLPSSRGGMNSLPRPGNVRRSAA